MLYSLSKYLLSYAEHKNPTDGSHCAGTPFYVVINYPLYG